MHVCFWIWLSDMRKPTDVLFSKEDYVTGFQNSLFSCSSSYRLNLFSIPLSKLAILFLVVFVQPMFRQFCWQHFMGMASDMIRRHNLTVVSLVLLFFFLLFYFTMFLGLSCGNCFAKCIHWDWAQHFHGWRFLQLSLFFAKRRIHVESLGPRLQEGIRTNVYNIARDYTDLVTWWRCATLWSGTSLAMGIS